MSRDRATEDALLRLKVHVMANGLDVTQSAVDVLSRDGRPLTIHEYATTGGITLRIGDLFLNAPFDEWYCERSRAQMDVIGGELVVRFAGDEHGCEVLPLPGYLDSVNARGESVTATTMSHADRIRISPISGCAWDCHFCDMPSSRYSRHSVEELLASIEVARRDPYLPAQHMLISGGSPGPAHTAWFDDMVQGVLAGCDLPTDVMMGARAGSLDYLERFVDAGVVGFSLNLEVSQEEAAQRVMPRKRALSSPYFESTIREAVRLLGAGTGAVRSILIVGLEPIEDTLAAVEMIARLGADPVLSPFRPAQRTRLEHADPPSERLLLDVFERASEIVDRHGVALGPRCIPCQHNTLTSPWGTAYSSWAEGSVHR